MKHGCAVFFRRGTCDLEQAAKALEACRLTVTRSGDRLTVTRPDAPTFRVSLSDAPHVARVAIEIAAGTEHQAAMAAFDARFEISIEDLDEALDEINTLMEVQVSLQDASNGYLFIPWSGVIAKPWSATDGR